MEPLKTVFLPGHNGGLQTPFRTKLKLIKKWSGEHSRNQDIYLKKGGERERERTSIHNCSLSCFIIENKYMGPQLFHPTLLLP